MTDPRTPRRPSCPPTAHRLLRGVGVAALVVALTGAAGCELRLGEGSPAALPSASVTEASRDALARQATLISTTASVVSVSAGAADSSQTTAALTTTAQAQVEALGGVWEPWPTAVPTTYPTATPAATAAADATLEDLTTALSDGIALSSQAALTAEDAASARLFTAITVSWAVSLEELLPGTISTDDAWAGREGPTLTKALPGELLLTYDAARYALEEVAARSPLGSDERNRATTEAEDARTLVFASVALGGDDPRLPAYAAPSAPADSATSLDTTWARQVWSDVLDAEVQGVGSAAAGSEDRKAGVSAAVRAALTVHTWGTEIGDLPGYAAS